MDYPYTRTRTKTYNYVNQKNPSSNGEYSADIQVFRAQKRTGSNPILHTKIINATSGTIFSYDSGQTVSVDTLCPIFISLAQLEAYTLQSVPAIPLNWKKLESSSDFGLIQALAELDDSVAIFTRRFWQQLSYGSLTWGVMPFLSDLQALIDQAQSLARRVGGDPMQYEEQVNSTYTVPVVFAAGNGTWEGTLELDVTTRHTGVVTLPGAGILEGFDRLGFHPDVATAWDLVPLSFVVDYLLPIGDVLERFSDRGWVKAVNFTGWQTHKILGTFTGSRRNAGSDSGTWSEKIEFETFKRDRLSSAVLLDDGPNLDDVQWLDIPSPRAVFNMLYLSLGRVRSNQERGWRRRLRR